MVMGKTPRVPILLIAIFSLLWACAGGQLNVEPIGKSENPAEHMEHLAKDIIKARKNQLDVLAPTWFAKANTALNDAKASMNRGDEASKVLQKVAEGRARLHRAEEVAHLARSALPGVIKARDLARAAGATRFEDDYWNAEARFLKLTRAIEKNKVQWAREKSAKVAVAFDQLELQAIKERFLREVRRLMEQAENAGAQKMAPETYAVAETKLTEADTFISKHRYEEETIRRKASEALFQARRLLHVTGESEKIKTMKPEQITLWAEGILHKTTTELTAPDMRDRTFDKQVENILRSIAALRKDHQLMASQLKSQQAEIDAMKKQITALKGITREEEYIQGRLAAERRLSQLFREIRKSFRPTEAEVYKQADRLVIRLKAMEFPSGKHFIMSSNYALLSKVQRAIRVCGKPNVTIEGHTDSTGSDKLNKHLSHQRAEAVRAYFVANGTLPRQRVKAVGYGSKRPLASNATAKGRAINRRIDLIIVPSR